MCGVFLLCDYLFVFFKQETASEMRMSDWSSGLCSSDLRRPVRPPLRHLLWSGRRVLMRTSVVTLRRTTALASLLLAGTATVAHAQWSWDAGPGSDAPGAADAAA